LGIVIDKRSKANDASLKAPRILGIWPRVFLLAVAGLTGYWFAPKHFDGDIPEPIRTRPAEQLAPDAQPEASATQPVTCEPIPEKAPGRTPTGGKWSSSPPELPATNLPLRYHVLVEPAPRGPNTLPEWYAAFIEEPRDESWAPAVESAISETIAVSGVKSIQAEYVMCGTSRCTIAGYVDSTVDFDSCQIGGWIGNARIFRQTFGFTCTEVIAGGLQRFIVFLDSERQQ
jgi:hypothetical protein